MLAEPASLRNSIEVIEASGTWIVRIVESGRDPRVADFELESFALSYAEGQRRRLKAPEIIRI
jgi:hypothetical protein